MTVGRRKICPVNTCLPCDTRRRRATLLPAGELFAAKGQLRVRLCPIHGDHIGPGEDPGPAVDPPAVVLPRPKLRLRAKPGAQAAGVDTSILRDVRRALATD